MHLADESDGRRKGLPILRLLLWLRWSYGCAREGGWRVEIVVAVMRKLLVICFGVLKTGRPFDAARAMPAR